MNTTPSTLNQGPAREGASRMRTVFHVTAKRNLKAIRSEGLVPRVGERSEQLNEEPAVYLFPSKEAMNDALGSWLGDQFDEDEELVALAVEVEAGELVPSSVEYEVLSSSAIPPEQISVYGEV